MKRLLCLRCTGGDGPEERWAGFPAALAAAALASCMLSFACTLAGGREGGPPTLLSSGSVGLASRRLAVVVVVVVVVVVRVSGSGDAFR